ncbi:TPA: glycosyltransferase family 2 protein, partial [Escherichia coli]|nr:glycosyltransferase family 2 protein [Escherichia coli]EFJ8256791.1 glycosyltransferase family 2 protein [Escherichia coli]EFQ2010287.1 glycosyltransferase family 2 protein [Escherichia coli]EHO8688732.1 glycosyltransferase family 2 protein [Escherichia coli]EIX5845389.1 glycosyltransferase family 2 protein [Escherichia coli]
RLIKSDVNLGYFGGLNLGLKGLPRNHPIVVGNNDLVYESNFTQIISQTTYPDDALVIAPNVITKDGYHQNPHCRKRVSKFRKFLYDIYFSNYIAALVLTWGSRFLNYLKGGRNNSFDQGRGYIHMGIGACYVLMPSFFKYFDELDNKVFLYGEEAYLAGQLMEVNGKIFYEPDAIVHHEESATLAKVASKTKYGYMKSSYYDYKKYL